MTRIDWELMAHAWLASAVLMAVLWVVHRRIRDAGVVDVGWAFSLGASAVYASIIGDGDPVRRAIIGAMGGVWGLRLAWHLLVDRVIPPGEDGRYEALREKWGGAFTRRMFWFFQAQALTVGLLCAPFVIASSGVGGPVGWLDWLGLGVWLTGLVGETIADRQLARFKRRPDSRGKTCREGLWRYSRHPNYFFEWLMWLSYGVVALSVEGGWIALFAPAVILFLVLKVTGIPPTEARALQSRGEDYREYQRTTSAFVPWFPKRRPA